MRSSVAKRYDSIMGTRLKWKGSNSTFWFATVRLKRGTGAIQYECREAESGFYTQFRGYEYDRLVASRLNSYGEAKRAARADFRQVLKTLG